MGILNTENEEDGVAVTAVAAGKKETFYVQLTDGKYRIDLGCWITTDTSGGDIDPDDYPDFDIGAIITAAEDHAAADFASSFEEVEIDFHCYLNSVCVCMRIDKESGAVELLLKNVGHDGDYQRKYEKTGVKFDNKEAAQAFADTFRTDDYNDIAGLHYFMIAIRRKH